MIDVTVIMPLYNSEGTMSESIDSVLNQTFVNLELILIDDCSSDGSLNIALGYKNSDDRVRVMSTEINSGAAVARNLGIKSARGRFIAFLDSDDLWYAIKLEVQISFMLEHNYGFTFTAYEKINENGTLLESLGVPQEVSYSDLLKVCSVGCLTAIYDTHIFGKVYMPLIRKRQDLGLWLRLLKSTKKGYGLNITLASYRLRSNSISSNKKNAAIYTWRLYRDVESISFFKAVFYFSHYAFNGVMRSKLPWLARSIGVLHQVN